MSRCARNDPPVTDGHGTARGLFLEAEPAALLLLLLGCSARWGPGNLKGGAAGVPCSGVGLLWVLARGYQPEKLVGHPSACEKLE